MEGGTRASGVDVEFIELKPREFIELKSLLFENIQRHPGVHSDTLYLCYRLVCIATAASYPSSIL